MIDRFYIRSPVTGISEELQEKMLSETGYKGDAIYRDIISSARMKSRKPDERQALLVQRASMLRPTSRKEVETIGVASLRVLALNPADLMQALSAAFLRGSTILTLDTGISYSEHVPGMAEAAKLLGDAASEYTLASRRAQTADGRLEGVQQAKAKAAKKRKPKLIEALPLWVGTDHSEHEIAKIVGLSVSTLNRHLGTRGEARKKAAKKGKML